MTDLNLAPLQATLTIACAKVVSVSVPNPSNKATWVVQYGSTPTSDELAAVATAIAAFDVTLLTMRRKVDKAKILDRLIAAGKDGAAYTAFDLLPRVTQERWNVRTAVFFDDAETVSFLTGIGADSNAILAP